MGLDEDDLDMFEGDDSLKIMDLRRIGISLRYKDSK
jgi:hypothetical protein